jgi:hypothetical protein
VLIALCAHARLCVYVSMCGYVPRFLQRGSVIASSAQGVRSATFWAIPDLYPCGTPKKAAVM